MASKEEILEDIAHLYTKIDQAYRSKQDLASEINKSREEISSLEIFLVQDEERILLGKKPRYDRISMLDNIERCKGNILLFEQTMQQEDKYIARYKEVIAILQEDIKRPNELVIDMSKVGG